MSPPVSIYGRETFPYSPSISLIWAAHFHRLPPPLFCFIIQNETKLHVFQVMLLRCSSDPVLTITKTGELWDLTYEPHQPVKTGFFASNWRTLFPSPPQSYWSFKTIERLKSLNSMDVSHFLTIHKVLDNCCDRGTWKILMDKDFSIR